MIPSDSPLVELHHCCLTIQITLSCGSARNVHAAAFGLWWNIRLCGGFSRQLILSVKLQQHKCTITMTRIAYLNDCCQICWSRLNSLVRQTAAVSNMLVHIACGICGVYIHQLLNSEPIQKVEIIFNFSADIFELVFAVYTFFCALETNESLLLRTSQSFNYSSLWTVSLHKINFTQH